MQISVYISVQHGQGEPVKVYVLALYTRVIETVIEEFIRSLDLCF